MTVDLCFMHAEVGHPYIPGSEKAYRPLAERMVESFNNCTDDDEGIIQFADMESEPIQGAHSIIRSKVTRENLMVKRAESLRDYARKASHNMVMADVDMVWKQNPAPIFKEDFDVGLCWRAADPAMPYIGCLMFIRHGSEAALNFLIERCYVASAMPAEMRVWWGDQLSLTCMLGPGKPNTLVNYNGCKIRIFDAGRIMFNIDGPGQKPPEGVFVTHYKGDRKELRV